GKVYKKAIIDKVIPAILERFPPRTLARGVVIQQDNASPHRCVTTEVLAQRGLEKIRVENQPPNSPDFNVLDLGFFNSIQSLQHQKSTRSIEELIGAVEAAFYELPMDTLSKTFITLQKVMQTSIEMLGSNNYKLPHMRKDATISDLALFNVECNLSAVEGALLHLESRLGEESHLEALVNSQEQVESSAE
ncbi:hypothetical protein AaE_002856, partial [Aphanomyces astaci]